MSGLTPSQLAVLSALLVFILLFVKYTGGQYNWDTERLQTAFFCTLSKLILTRFSSFYAQGCATTLPRIS